MERIAAVCGIAAIVAAAVLMSNNRKAINWRTVGVGLLIQFALAAIILRVPVTKDLFLLMATGINKLLDSALDGATFLFTPAIVRGQFIFVIRVGAAIIFVSALAALLYYFGVMQRIIKLCARGLTRSMGISGPEAVSAAAAVFVGQVECQVLIRPYMNKLSSSELFCSLTAAMATIAGSALVSYVSMGMNPVHLIAASVMSAVGGITMAKIFFPETKRTDQLIDEVDLIAEDDSVNALDAFTKGAQVGGNIAWNVMVCVLAAVAFISLVNLLLGASLATFGWHATVQDILGVLFTPIAFLLGVPWHEAFHAGRLMATEILINEFAAYSELSKVIAGTAAYAFANKTQLIVTCALCGFCNIGSLAINIAGLSAMAPERRGEIARLAVRALIAANFATWITAAMAGLLF